MLTICFSFFRQWLTSMIVMLNMIWRRNLKIQRSLKICLPSMRLKCQTMSLKTKDWTTMDITLTTSRSRKSPYMQERLGMLQVEVQTNSQCPPQPTGRALFRPTARALC